MEFDASDVMGRMAVHQVHPRLVDETLGEAALRLRLIDEAGVDLVHGHSSHHVRGIELHNGKPILYGCGDLITDYEGLPKRPERRPFASELGLIYLARFAAEDGRLLGLEMRPMRMVQMRLRRGSTEDCERLCAILNQQGATLGTRAGLSEGVLHLEPLAA